MKKPLSLKDAMRSLHVIETNEGIELQSAAGTAKYDAWGARREVNGIPEYFPSSVTVNKRQPAPVDDKGPSVSDEPRAPLVRAIKVRVEIDTTDVQKIICELDDKIRNSDAFKVLKASMSLCVEGDQRKVAFEADRFKVNEAAQSASNNEETAFNGGLAFCGFPGAISHDGANPADGDKATAEPISSIASATGIATKTRLTDEMQELVVKAVRESDLFTSIQTAIDAQAASAVALQQAVNDVVGDAIRNALKPGGMIWTSFQSCRH
ncbi:MULTISPECIES: hypothetical protein [Enterobacter]|nr:MULTISPECIES: hypothetical protein [Enterobacter cloacae complex]KVJ09544.1 hypothetical protein AWS40_23820 [Enterobacter asburiae]CZY46480.1 Uncharacterised protein [Enterobacter cloacae]VAL80465.1 Uncharacterised protein [Enterobacter hormaechei]